MSGVRRQSGRDPCPSRLIHHLPLIFSTITSEYGSTNDGDSGRPAANPYWPPLCVTHMPGGPFLTYADAPNTSFSIDVGLLPLRRRRMSCDHAIHFAVPPNNCWTVRSY